MKSYRKKITAAIAATVMITALFMSLGSAAGSHTAEVDVTPKDVKGDSRILFEITVTNSFNSPDNIDKIWISGDAFTEPIGDSGSGENMENAGDNLATASDFLTDAASNLSDASDDKRSAGSEILDTSEDVGDAGDLLLYMDYHKAGGKFKAASNYLQFAGENLNGVTDVPWTVSQLIGASNSFGVAADNFNNTATGNWDENTYWMLENVKKYLKQAADNFVNGSIGNLEWNLDYAAWALKRAGENMKVSTNANVNQSGTRIINAGNDLKDAALDFEALENNLIEVKKEFGSGQLENAARAFVDAGMFLGNIVPLEDAASNFREVGVEMMLVGQSLPQNIYFAGSRLSSSGDNLFNAGGVLMKALGGDHLKDAGSAVSNAGDNMASTSMFDLMTGASELSDAADYISSGATELKSVGSNLKDTTPEGLSFDTLEGSWTAIGPTGENTLAPGESATLPVILRTGDTGENTFMVYTRDTTDATDDYKFTISVDAEPPKLSGRVYQSDVGENNLVGDEYNDGRSTVEITSDQALSSIGDVKLIVDGENIKKFDLDNENNKTFTAEFDVEEWDENNCAIWVESATDTYGLENTSVAGDNLITFDVDTRPPTWSTDGESNTNSGFEDAKDRYVENKSAKLTGENLKTVLATDYTTWTVNGEVSDNDAGYYSGVDIVRFMANGTQVETSAIMDDNTFSADDVNLMKGLNELAVQAVDKTGNTLENSLDTLFIDNAEPRVKSWSLNGTTWDENEELVNTDQPTISLTIADAGLGVHYDNLEVVLDEDENIYDVFPEWGGKLENASLYEWADGQAAWENTLGLEYDDEALPDGLYWIGVNMNDNIHFSTKTIGGVTLQENTVEYRSFRIDTHDPSSPELDQRVYGQMGRPGLKTRDDTITLSGEVSKSSWEDYEDLTVKVYVDDSEAATATPNSHGSWSTDVSLPSGTNRVEVTLVDAAGNESEESRYGYVMMDDTPPDVSITAPSEEVTTSKTTVRLKAIVSDDIVDPVDIGVSMRSPYYTIPEKRVTVASDGSFSMDAPLAEGSNMITVVARDEAGNVSTDSIIVTRTVPKPANWQMYATILAIIAIILAAIAVIRRST